MGYDDWDVGKSTTPGLNMGRPPHDKAVLQPGRAYSKAATMKPTPTMLIAQTTVRM